MFYLRAAFCAPVSLAIPSGVLIIFCLLLLSFGRRSGDTGTESNNRLSGRWFDSRSGTAEKQPYASFLHPYISVTKQYKLVAV